MEKENYVDIRLTQVHLEKWPLKWCVCVHVCVFLWQIVW